ncbi:MAG: transposase [Thioploca sp.]|nr:transposase [Thioploca sp.]
MKELIEPHNRGEIELWFFDESGFDQQLRVPYAWQPLGSTLEIPSQNRTRLNVLGFVTLDNQLESYCFEGTINTDVVVACLEQFASLQTSKPRYVIIDNASIQPVLTSLLILISGKRKVLSSAHYPLIYSPELNRIEILWRFIKYSWLPVLVYLSFNNLVRAVENILRQFGSQLVTTYHPQLADVE